jgi:hypothetical protein
VAPSPGWCSWRIVRSVLSLLSWSPSACEILSWLLIPGCAEVVVITRPTKRPVLAWPERRELARPEAQTHPSPWMHQNQCWQNKQLRLVAATTLLWDVYEFMPPVAGGMESMRERITRATRGGVNRRYTIFLPFSNLGLDTM